MSLNCSIIHLLLTSTASTTSNSSNVTHQLQPQLINSSLVIEIARGLHQRREFRNFVFYISQRLQADIDLNERFFQDFRRALPLVPVTLIVENSQMMVGLLSTPCLCFVLTTQWDDPIMELAALSLESIRYFETLFLLYPLQELQEDEQEDYEASGLSFVESFEFYDHIRLLYEWVWQQQFLNTVLITVNNNIFLYDPFPTGSVLNKTGDWSLDDLFRKDKLNLKGLEIKTPVRFDLPGVFCLRRYPNKGRVSKLTGSAGKLFGAFIHEINGTFNDQIIHEHEFEHFNMTNFLKMVELGELQISVHAYTSMRDDGVGTSYPVGINDWCIMVPFRNSSPEYMFLQKSFQQNSWFLLCFAAVYLTLGIWLCSPQQQRDISLSFLQAICSLLLITPVKFITLPNARLRFLFVLLFVLGFCITNMYLSKMASYLTASSSQDQINTVEDLVAAQLNIMIMDFELNYLLDMKLNFTPGFLDLVIPVSKAVMDKHRDHLNTSYAYSVASDTWDFLNKQQRFLKKPIFRLSPICIGPFYHVFPLQKDSYLMQPLKDFILDVSKTGYIFFWEDEAFDDALFLGYVQMFKNDHELAPLSMNFYRSICYVWLFGLLVASVTFVLELRGLTVGRMFKFVGKLCGWLLRKYYEL